MTYCGNVAQRAPREERIDVRIDVRIDERLNDADLDADIDADVDALDKLLILRRLVFA